MSEHTWRRLFAAPDDRAGFVLGALAVVLDQAASELRGPTRARAKTIPLGESEGRTVKHPGAIVLVVIVFAIVVGLIFHESRVCVARGEILAETADGARCVPIGPEVTR